MKKLILVISIAFGLTMLSAPFVQLQAQTKTVTKSKKGWSHRKKYAVIGGATGAVVGAVASKHRVKGALIGGALGAGEAGGRPVAAAHLGAGVGRAHSQSLPLKKRYPTMVISSIRPRA